VAEKKTKPDLVPPQSSEDSAKSDVVDTIVEMAAIPFFIEQESDERNDVSTPTINEMAPENEDEDEIDFDENDDTVRISADPDEDYTDIED